MRRFFEIPTLKQQTGIHLDFKAWESFYKRVCTNKFNPQDEAQTVLFKDPDHTAQ